MTNLSIKRLKIKNFKGIEALELHFNEKLNVLIGKNGMGKTSVLFALAMALSRFIGRIRSLNSNGITFFPADIKNNANEATIEVEMIYRKRNINWRIGKQRHQTKQTITNLEDINKMVLEVNENLVRDPNCPIPVVILYGVSRSVLDIPLKIKKTHIFEQLAAYDEALRGERRENDFRLFFEWFRNREDVENETIRDLVQPNFFDNNHSSFTIRKIASRDSQLEAVRKAIHAIIPAFSDLRVRRNPLRMVVTKSTNNTKEELNISQLSEGEKCTLALAGDLARRLSIANPTMNNPLCGDGIVLIDEIDLHLHPQWERQIMPCLRQTFPNCQFIVTTHSPQVLSELEPESIFILSEKDEKIAVHHPELAKGLSVNDILGSMMDDPARNQDIAEKLKEIDCLLEEENVEEARAKLEGLKSDLHGKKTPEMCGQEAMLGMLEAGVLSDND